MATQQDADSLLDEILAAYLRAAQAGLAPSRQHLLDTYPELAGELEEIFADQDQVEQLAAPLRALAVENVPLQPGLVLDDYELLEEIAHGGMGVVYRACQKSLSRIVAVKILRADPLPHEEDLHRFRTETEAVAHLDHPHIVPIYDVGSHAGRPWFSMKLMEGGNLAQHRQLYRTNATAAAELMATLADTIHFAHERGILHRDLKPANILLDAQGAPYVSDFGLAKRLSPATSARASSDSTLVPTVSLHTLSGAILGTPSYMAPEQAAGQRNEVTTATDVYGLGAILYELLAGRPPFRGENLIQTLRSLQEDDPVPPRSVNPGVPRDLETICLKCLRKSPTERYASARALAQDLRRFLQGESISARPPRRLERLARLCLRNPWVTALTVCLVGVILTALVLVTWQWRRAEDNWTRAENALADSRKHQEDTERALQESQQNLNTAQSERDRAENNLERAEEILNTFCLRLSEKTLSNISGLQPVRRELLQSGRRYYEDLLKQHASSDPLRERLARAHHLLGDVNNVIGSRTETLQAYQLSLALYRELQAAHPESTEYAYRVASAHQRIAIVNMAFNHVNDAFASYEEARKILEPLHARVQKNHDELKTNEVQMELANLHNNLAVLCVGRGRWQEAQSHYQQNLSLLEDLRQRSDQVVVSRALGNTLINLGIFQARRDQLLDAWHYFVMARDLLEILHNKWPKDEETTLYLATAYFRLGMSHCAVSEWDQSLPLFETSKKLLEPLIQANPSVRSYPEVLADVQRHMGHAYRETNRFSQALALYDKGLELLDPLCRRDPSAGALHKMRAGLHFDKGCVFSRMRRNVEAFEELSQARALYIPLATESPDNAELAVSLAMTLNNRSLELEMLQKRIEALPCALEACEFIRTALARHPQSSRLRDLLGTSYRHLLRLQMQSGQHARALETSAAWRKLRPGDPLHLYRIASEMALLVQGSSSDPEAPGPGQPADQEAWAHQIVDILAEAARLGLPDSSKRLQDPVFMSLRTRKDFQHLLDGKTASNLQE